MHVQRKRKIGALYRKKKEDTKWNVIDVHFLCRSVLVRARSFISVEKNTDFLADVQRFFFSIFFYCESLSTAQLREKTKSESNR